MREPEQQAREDIDRLLQLAGWAVQDLAAADLRAATGVAIRESALNPGHGFVDKLADDDQPAAST